MLISPDGKVQPAIGTQSHWQMFREVSAHPDLFHPLRAEVIELVNAATRNNPGHPFLDSRRGGAETLSKLSSWWHGEYARRFATFPNGSERGVFGMVVWNYLAGIVDHWHFARTEDTHGYGQRATRYWR